MANAAYVAMQNLGYRLGQSFNMGQAVSLFKTNCRRYAKRIIAKKMSEIKDGMLLNVMWIQFIIVMVFVAFKNKKEIIKPF